ncbi:hypothetical protein Athai_09140 [Actinocatenispora thailandica]|uniref:Carrier domain-containing protein n=1 Tax=Actinocatenispora thailandica TaxID=227318 RepID=A0A7R7HVC2_9ACTN|nr:acyl carrier protein [Actinocatenispora thailandica]BCJ33411.1 hypothetical protein Athai_09140 [Actinocatenispora thailandica]
MNTHDARQAVLDSLLMIAPEADPQRIDPDDPLREAAGLDSLDFLSFVENLSTRTGTRIEESDYDDLATIADATAFVQRAA